MKIQANYDPERCQGKAGKVYTEQVQSAHQACTQANMLTFRTCRMFTTNFKVLQDHEKLNFGNFPCLNFPACLELLM